MWGLAFYEKHEIIFIRLKLWSVISHLSKECMKPKLTCPYIYRLGIFWIQNAFQISKTPIFFQNCDQYSSLQGSGIHYVVFVCLKTTVNVIPGINALSETNLLSFIVFRKYSMLILFKIRYETVWTFKISLRKSYQPLITHMICFEGFFTQETSQYLEALSGDVNTS